MKTDAYFQFLQYTHDGSETAKDKIQLQVEFLNPNDSSQPLWELQIHELRIEIEPVNDPPKIHLPQGDHFFIASNSKRLLTQDFLQILDPDSVPSEVIVSIVHIDTTKGFFEFVDRSEVPVSQFTSEDIINEKIRYVHRESQRSDLVLKAYDGRSESRQLVIHVDAYEINLQQIRNTGIELLVGGSAPITEKNLSFTTNAPNQDVGIEYRIVRVPRHGFVEVERQGEWWLTEIFNQVDLVEGRVRYRHGKQNGNTFDYCNPWNISPLEIIFSYSFPALSPP